MMKPRDDAVDKPLYCELLSPIFHCRVHGRPLDMSDWQRWDTARAGWRRTQLCLAFLLHRDGQWSTREQLEQVIWNQYPVPKDGLSRVLITLKNILARGARSEQSCIILEQCNASYRLKPGTFRTDVQLFRRDIERGEELEEHDEQGALDSYKAAVQRYQAHYLSVFGPFILWGESQRMYLLNSYLLTCERLANDALMQGNATSCIQYASLGIQADPSATELYVLAMQVLWRAHRISEVDALYQKYQQTIYDLPEQDDPVLVLYKQIKQRRARK